MKRVIGILFCVLFISSCSNLSKDEIEAKEFVENFLFVYNENPNSIKDYYPYAYYLNAKTPHKITNYTIDSVITSNKNNVSVYLNWNNEQGINSNLAFHLRRDSLSNDQYSLEKNKAGTSLFLSDNKNLSLLHIMSDDSVKSAVYFLRDSIINSFPSSSTKELKIFDSEGFFDFENDLDQTILSSLSSIEFCNDVFKQKYLRAASVYLNDIASSINSGEMQLLGYTWGNLNEWGNTWNTYLTATNKSSVPIQDPIVNLVAKQRNGNKNKKIVLQDFIKQGTLYPGESATIPVLVNMPDGYNILVAEHKVTYDQAVDYILSSKQLFNHEAISSWSLLHLWKELQ